MRALSLATLGLVTVVGAAPTPARAQELTPPPAVVRDTLTRPADPTLGQGYGRPVSPMGAFWRSLLIPGWGQAKLNRKLTGALFIGFEGIALGMVVKSNHQLEYIKRTGSQSDIEAKEQEREDWITLLLFNHLLSGVEAYVAAHLWDFPADLQLQAGPGDYSASVTVPVRFP